MAWMLSISFGLLWLLLAGQNAYLLWQAKQQHTSTSLVLVIGGVFGALAVLIVPIANTVYWCWIPLLLDVGCVPALWKIWRGKHHDSSQ
ncbi:MAG: hypothetical protein IPL02_05810 [Moraxellaceae bacterium]|nr:hypothetical protein [Moraxellaceae bacterium]